MAVPALLYVLINLRDERAGVLGGWAIPAATDIAFALAVLAVISTHLPSALRTFLLTLAVVDDLLAILVIAVFYTSSLSVVPLLLALVPLAIFGFLVQKRVRRWWLLMPLALATWVLVHASCSPSPCRWSAARRRAGPTPVPDSRSTSSTGSGRSPPPSPSRCSPSCRPASRSAGWPGWGRR
jgi:hypothetical protein